MEETISEAGKQEQAQHRSTLPGRLRFMLGDQVTDLILPPDVPLGELLPAVLRRFGSSSVEQGAEHEGYVVQRAGDPPLSEESTPAELGLLDGETLHLRPRAGQLAPIDYDDLVDGVAEQVRDHPGAWTTARSRWLLLLSSGATWGVGLLVLVLDGGSAVMCATMAGAAALALLGAAGLLARAAARSATATMLAASAVVHAAVASGLAVEAVDQSTSWLVRLAGAGVGALVALVCGLVLIADAGLLFAGALAAVLLALIPLMMVVATGLSTPEVAAIGLVLTLIAGLFVPGLAFRLGGLTLPMLPTNSDELRQDIDPVPHEVVVKRGRAVIGYLSALYLGSGVAQVLLVVLFLPAQGTFAFIFNAVLVPLLLLRAAHLDGVLQRWAIVVPAGVASVTVVARMVRGGLNGPEVLVRIWLPIIVIGAGLIVAAQYLPGRRLRPYWGRIADILESLSAIALLPLLAGVLDLYRYAHGLGG
jgi:type VII secretion integral membrane protein EccD